MTGCFNEGVRFQSLFIEEVGEGEGWGVTKKWGRTRYRHGHKKKECEKKNEVLGKLYIFTFFSVCCPSFPAYVT